MELIKKKQPYTYLYSQKAETPFYASFLQASFTIEATILLPIFLTMMMVGIFSFKVLTVEAGVQRALNMACRTMAVVGYDEGDIIANEEKQFLFQTISYTNLLLSEYRVPTKYIKGNRLGLNFSDSTVDGNYLRLNVRYKIPFPIRILGKHEFQVTQEAKCRMWVGYDHNEGFLTQSGYVYLAENPEVYHLDINCSYLSPSVMPANAKQTRKLRNKNNEKYRSCMYCKGNKNDGTIYITEYGTRYHSDANCSRIRRHVRRVPFEDVDGIYPPCSKCGMDGIEEE